MPTLPDLIVSTAPATAVVISLPAVVAGGLLTGFTQPGSGGVVLNPDQTLTYTPSQGFLGSDDFAYAVSQGGSSLEGRVWLSVAEPNIAPVAVDDIASVAADGAVDIAVTANDTDENVDPLTIASFTMPAHGVVTLEPDQKLQYAPQKGFAGTDSFSYAVSDGRGGLDTANVELRVEGANTLPIVRDDDFTVLTGEATTLPILANDTDPDGDPLTIVEIGLPAEGTLQVNPDQTVTYTPKPGFAGRDEFVYSIRDRRGNIGEGRVSVTVTRPNEAPITHDDVATTGAGEFVTISVLANDTDPDSDPISLAALVLPESGSLKVNLNQTVTYTPAPGFSGKDEFRYTIKDDWGGSASGQVEVIVTKPATVPTYANGYVYRRLLVVPPTVVKGEHMSFPLWLRLGGDWLKPKTVEGGRLEGGDQLDIRFELADGTKLKHDVDAYDAAAGKASIWVQLPLLSDKAANSFYIYYGKAGLAAAEVDPAAVWADYLAVWHLPTTSDRSNHNRSLTKTGTVIDDTGGLAGASNIGGSGVLTRGDAGSWLNDLSAISFQCRARADVAGNSRGFVNCGPFGADDESALTIRFAGGKGALYAKLKTSAGDAAVTTQGNMQNTSWRAYALTWAAGDPTLSLFIDGIEAPTTSVANIMATGDAKTAITGALVLGAGSRDAVTGGWDGALDEVRIRAAKLSAEWVAAESANQAAPEAFYGVGSEDTADDRHAGVVAVPVRATMIANGWVDLDVLGQAMGPSDGEPLSIIAIANPANGTATVVNGKIRYTPVFGFVGADIFTYSLMAGDKRSTARVTVIVGPQVITNPPPEEPISVTTSAELRAALSEAEPGDYIVLAEGVYPGSFTIPRSGTAEKPIFIQCNKILGATITGNFVVKGADVVLSGLVVKKGIELYGDRDRASRCKVDDSGGTAPMQLLGGQGIVVEYCDFSRYAAVGVRCTADTKRPHVYRNWLHDQASPLDPLNVAGIVAGSSKATSVIKIEAHIEENLLENLQGRQAIELKSSNNRVEGNTVIGTSSRPADILVRHGLDNILASNCAIEGRVLVNDQRTIAIRNHTSGKRHGPCIGVKAGTLRGDELRAGHKGYPIAEHNRIIANEGEISVGWRSPDWGKKPIGTKIEAHDRTKWPVKLTFADASEVNYVTSADYKPMPAAPRQLSRADVGPFANL